MFNLASFLKKERELCDCSYIDVLFHSLEDWKDFKQLAMTFFGKASGLSKKFIHCSLKVSIGNDENDPHQRLYDFTDRGIMSYETGRRRVKAIIRFYFDHNQGISDCLNRISQISRTVSPLDWGQAIPILKGEEPESLVCTTFILHALPFDLPTNYQTPDELFDFLCEKKETIKKVDGMRDVALYLE